MLVAAHVRLSQGPMSLAFLVAPIERAIDAELGGLTVKIRDAVMQRTGGWTGIEFRLTDVRLLDSDRMMIAQAPAAAIALSRSALLQGRVAPARVDLIRPRIRLFYSSEGGLSLNFQRAVESGGSEPTQPGAAAQDDASGARHAADAAQDLPRALHRIDIAATLTEAIARARHRDGGASFLSTLGVREAMLLIEHNGRQSVWRVPEFSIGLDHRQRRSTIVGTGKINAGTGLWTLRFQADDAEKSQTLRLRGRIEDLVPRGMAANLPLLSSLQMLDAPLLAEANVELTRAGEIIAGEAVVTVGQGRLIAPSLMAETVALDQGRVELNYNHKDRQIEVRAAQFLWQGGNLDLQGRISPGPEDAPNSSWDFAFAARSGMLRSDWPARPQIPLQALTVSGQIASDRGLVLIEKLTVAAEGATGTFAGTVQHAGVTPLLQLDGVIGPMSLQAVKALWPASLSAESRTWVRNNVARGKILGGKLRLRSETGGNPGEGNSLTIDAADIVMNCIETLPPLEVPKGSVRLTDTRLELTAPDASITTPAGRKLVAKAARFLIADHRPKLPEGELTFRAQGGVAGAIEFFDLPPFEAMKSSGLSLDAVNGNVDGQVRLLMPMSPTLKPADMRFEGKARVSELNAKSLIGAIDLLNGTINIEASDKLAEAKGDLLLNGVPAKLHWQRPFRDAADRPASLRLTSRLDNAYRDQLGLRLNHVVRGEIPVELTMQSGSEGGHAHLTADLTQAELVLENFAWKKAPGRAARLDVDLAKGQTYKTELQNFKVVGDDIAVDGWAALGADQRLQAFNFPDFSINVITKLDVSGQLRADNVWEVKAKGATYDGRQLFRSMFSAGTISDGVSPAKNEAGLDLKAEVDTLVGFSDTLVHGFKVSLKKRDGKFVEMSARGEFPGESHPVVAASIQRIKSGGPRLLRAESEDAGAAFRLIGFYPNVKGGKAALEVNLDGRGAAEKEGTLWVRKFYLLGDPIVTEVLASSGEKASSRRGGAKKVVREEIYFERLRMPFLVGHGQLVLDESQINGPVLGATLKGKVDFDQRTVNLAGTYVPLYGLNAAISPVPILGDLLTGGQGKGVFGITFAVVGPLANPQVNANPLSIVAPGPLQGLFDMMQGSPQINERDDPGAKKAPPLKPKASGSEAMTGPARAKPAEASSSWSTETMRK